MIDRNLVTKTTTVVSDVNPRGVTISEIGTQHRIGWSYDATSGILSSTDVTTQTGPVQKREPRELGGQK